MNDPRDFLPAKYKNGQSSKKEANVSDQSKEEVSSPWKDLAKEPNVPEYRNDFSTPTDKKEQVIEMDSVPTNSVQDNIVKTEPQNTDNENKNNFPLKTGKKTANKLVGLLVVFFLVVGVFSSYLLTKQNQDNRQQASGTDPYSCNSGEPNCKCAYNGSTLECRIDTSDDGCDPGMTTLSNGDPGMCYNDHCRDSSSGGIICGYITDDDPCTSESMGGDWCDNPSTTHVETCEEAGLLRCHCGGTGNGWWVIGSGGDCGDICEDANAVCPSCNPPEEPPTTTTPPPTATPTPPPQPLVCGEFGCNQNSDCAAGLTCQSVTSNGQSKKICSKGENQLFCAANPTTANCCQSQPIPVCASIEMLDSTNNIMEGNDDADLKSGDEVRFRCSAVGNQDVNFNYEFRIWAPGTTTWTNITDTSGTVAKNISGKYVIAGPGHYVAQGRICVGTECQSWEIINGAPATPALTTQSCSGQNATACQTGYVCSAVPAGGCPTTTVNGVTSTTACASTPICRQAEGINCSTNSDCFDGYTCYQPPMPTCPAGMSCAQVMPAKYCKAE